MLLLSLGVLYTKDFSLINVNNDDENKKIENFNSHYTLSDLIMTYKI
jgi:hypothetical protein